MGIKTSKLSDNPEVRSWLPNLKFKKKKKLASPGTTINKIRVEMNTIIIAGIRCGPGNSAKINFRINSLFY